MLNKVFNEVQSDTHTKKKAFKTDSEPNLVDSKLFDSMSCFSESQVVKLEGIEHGVCNVIPDYQKEIALLKSQLAHKTALCDRIEGQKAYQTREINKVNGEKEALTRENKRLAAQLQENIDTWTKEKFILTEQVDLCKSIGQARQITEELVAFLCEERESKRQRGV